VTAKKEGKPDSTPKKEERRSVEKDRVAKPLKQEKRSPLSREKGRDKPTLAKWKTEKRNYISVKEGLSPTRRKETPRPD